MFVDLKTVPPEGQAVDRVIPGGGISLVGEEFRLDSDVELTGRVEPLSVDGPEEDESFRLRGRMSCRIALQCVRCLETFPLDVAESLDLVYLPQSKNVAPRRPGDPEWLDEDRSLDSDELSVSFYRDHHIDLGQAIREQIVLGLPMKPLCREDCVGLCPVCGTNRNEASCDCAPEETDPRWSELKTLLGR